MKPTPAEIRRKARRITRRADLPQNRRLAAYSWPDGMGGECVAMVKNRDRQVADALIQGPLWCASPVRVSDSVLRLRRDHGLPIETEYFSERDGDEKLTYGAYHLTAEVTREGE